MPVVYMATNTVNGKRYIGATKFTLEKRKTAHLYAACRGSQDCGKFYNALRKYGSERFSWVTLAEYAHISEAFETEKRLISDLKPEYNITSGGRGAFSSACSVTPWNCKKIMCLEDGLVFDTLEAAASFYSTRSGNLSDACRCARQATCNGKHFIYYTKDLTEQERSETIFGIDRYAIRRRKKRADSKPRNIRYPACSSANPLRRTRPVICVTTGKQFRSIADASDFYRVESTSISALCKNRQNRKTVGGLVFKYADKREAA